MSFLEQTADTARERNKIVSPSVCGILLLLLAALASRAQITEGRIFGKLRLASGQGISERIRIELQNLQGVTINVQYTDSNGNFSFLNLGNGKFQVVLVSDRYSAPVEIVQIHPDMPGVHVILYASVREEAATPIPSTPTADPFAVSVKEMLQTYPREAVKQYEGGLKKARGGDAEGAVKAYEKALQVSPNFYLAYNNLGVLYMNSGQPEKAVEQFEQAIRLNDKPGPPYTNLGRIYLERGDLEKAQEMLDKAVQKDQQSAVASFLAGSLYLRLGQNNKSEALLRRAHQLDPTFARVHLQLANLYMKQNRWQDILKELEAFLKEHSNDPQAQVVRQRLAALQDRKD